MKKRVLIMALPLMLAVILSGCENGDKTAVPSSAQQSPKPSETVMPTETPASSETIIPIETPEPTEEPDKVFPIEFQGIRFEIPEYFSTITEKNGFLYYIENDDTGIGFLADFSEDWKQTVKEYDSEAKFASAIAGSVVADQADPEHPEETISEALFVAGYTTHMIIFRSKEFPAMIGWVVISNAENGVMILVNLCFSDTDAPKHSYISDFQKMLQTAIKADIPAEITADPGTDETQAAGLRPEFKAAMDAYEAFYDEYCEYIKLFSEDPSNLEYLTKYTELVEKSSEMNDAFEKWNDGGLNDEETMYYLEVSNRIMKKLLSVAA